MNSHVLPVDVRFLHHRQRPTGVNQLATGYRTKSGPDRVPRRLVMAQIVTRTVRRAATGTELWNGNRERWRNVFSLDKNQSIIAWSWASHRKLHERYVAATTDRSWNALHFVRLRSRRQTRQWLRDLTVADGERLIIPATGIPIDDALVQRLRDEDQR